MPSTTANRSPKSGSADKSAVKQQLVQRLPYLRRYARALTGSQQIGDNYVRGCLETLVQEPELLNQADDVGVALFKLFHRFAHAVETSTDELAAIATQAKPKLLVLYHQMFHGVTEGQMLQDIRDHYTGAVVSAHDLDVY